MSGCTLDFFHGAAKKRFVSPQEFFEFVDRIELMPGTLKLTQKYACGNILIV